MSGIVNTEEYKIVCNDLKEDCKKHGKNIIGVPLGLSCKSVPEGMLVEILEYLQNKGFVKDIQYLQFKITYDGYEFFLNGPRKPKLMSL